MRPSRLIGSAVLAATAALAGGVAPATPAVAATATGNLGSVGLTVLPNRTSVTSGSALRATVTVRSTGAEAATAVTTCVLPPPQLTVTGTGGGERRGRQVCFRIGDMEAGTEASRTLVMLAVTDRHAVNVRLLARASSACQCSGRPTARSPVVRISRAGTGRMPVTG